jgi:outer membrane lipoprotein-sorting protein
MRMTGKIDAGPLRAKPPVPLYAVSKTRFKQPDKMPEAKVVQLPFVMDLKRPNKMRFEMEFRGATAVQAYDGLNGWKLRPFLGRREVEPFTTDEMKQAAQQQELDGFLINYAAKGTTVEADGMEKVNGQEAYKLKLTLRDGQLRHVWVDARTFLDVKIDGTRRMDGKSRQVATYFRDYRNVNGLKVPFVMETSVDGVNGSEKIVIQQVALNPKLTDAQFAIPSSN